MPRFFNTAGANQPEQHYTLPAMARLPEVRRLVDRGLYFVLHAPRQVGKTTALLSLAKELARGRRCNRKPLYTPLLASARRATRATSTSATSVAEIPAAVATQPQAPSGGRLPSRMSATSCTSEPT